MLNKTRFSGVSGVPGKALAILLSIALLIPMASAIIVTPGPVIAAPPLDPPPQPEPIDPRVAALPYYVVKHPTGELSPTVAAQCPDGYEFVDGYLFVEDCNHPGWAVDVVPPATMIAATATAPNAATITAGLAKNRCAPRTGNVLPEVFCVECQQKLYNDMFVTFSTFKQSYTGDVIDVPLILADSITNSVNSGNFDGPIFTDFIYDIVAPEMVADIAILMLGDLIDDILADVELPGFINAEDFKKAVMDKLLASLFDEAFIETVIDGPLAWPYTDPSLRLNAPYKDILDAIKADAAFITYLKAESVDAMKKTQADIIWNNGKPVVGVASQTRSFKGTGISIVAGHWNQGTTVLSGAGYLFGIGFPATRVQPRRWSPMGTTFDLQALSNLGPIIQNTGGGYTPEQQIKAMDSLMLIEHLDREDVFTRLNMDALIGDIQADYDATIVPAVTGLIDDYWDDEVASDNATLRAWFASYVNDKEGVDALDPSMSWDDMEKELAKTKTMSYTVNYYQDGSKVDGDTVTVSKEAWFYATQMDVEPFDAAADKYQGYKLDYVDPAVIPTKIDSGGVIKVYYVTDDDQIKDMSYKVEYYLNGIVVDTVTVTDSVQFNVTHMDVAPINRNKYTGYKVERTDPTPLPPTIVGGGVIKVYYVRDESVPPNFPKYVEPHPSPDTIRTIVKKQWVNGHLWTDEGYLIVYGCPGPTQEEGNLCAPKGGIGKPNEYCVDCQLRLKDVVPYPGTYTGAYTLYNGYLVVENCPGPSPLANNLCAPKTGNAKPWHYCVDCQLVLFGNLRTTVKEVSIPLLGNFMTLISGMVEDQLTSGNFDAMIKDSIMGMFDAEVLMPMITPMISDMIEATVISMGVPEDMDVAYIVDLIMQSDYVVELVNSLFATDYAQALMDKIVDDAFVMIMADPAAVDAIVDMAIDAVVSTLAARFWADGNPSSSHWSQTNRTWTRGSIISGITSTMIVEGIVNILSGNIASYIDMKYMQMGDLLDIVDMNALMTIALTAVEDVTNQFWVERWEPQIIGIAQGYIDTAAIEWFDGWSITAAKEAVNYISYNLALVNSGDWYNAMITAIVNAGFEVAAQTDENGAKVNYFSIVTTGGSLLSPETNRLVETGRAPNGVYTVEVAFSGYFDLSAYGFGTPVRLTLARETVMIEVEGRNPDGDGIFDKAIAQMLKGPSSEYHAIIADEFVEVAAIIAYDWVALQAELARGGFTDFEYFDYDADLQADMEQNRTPHAFAKKVVNGKTVVAVIIRGTGSEYDGIGSVGRWVSNLNMNTITGFHIGFYGAMERVYANLSNYLTKHNLSLKDGNTKLLVTGHSRGGAVGNLLAGYIQSNDLGNKENIYGYNFAATDIAIVDHVTKSAWENPYGAYNNIFNINNEWDLFAYFPGILTDLLGSNSSWAKYGRTLWFNDGSNNATLLGAHRPELYIQYIQATPSRLSTYNSGSVTANDILSSLLGGEAVYNEFNGSTYTSSQAAIIKLIFDPKTYADANPKVAKEVGLSTNALLKHFLDNSHSDTALLNAFSRVYDSDYYIANNSSIASVFKNDPMMMFKYFLTVGINAGDHSVEGWNVEDYKADNPGLEALYGNDLKMYYIHYNLYGL